MRFESATFLQSWSLRPSEKMTGVRVLTLPRPSQSLDHLTRICGVFSLFDSPAHEPVSPSWLEFWIFQLPHVLIFIDIGCILCQLINTVQMVRAFCWWFQEPGFNPQPWQFCFCFLYLANFEPETLRGPHSQDPSVSLVFALLVYYLFFFQLLLIKINQVQITNKKNNKSYKKLNITLKIELVFLLFNLNLF